MKKRIICAVILLAILLAQWLAAGLFDGLAPRVELNAYDYALPPSQGIIASDLDGLPGYSYRKTFTAEADGVPVNITVTNGAYDNYRDFKIIRGSFFTDYASSIGLNLAVISDELSFTLFQTLNTIGNEFRLNGLRYKIVGVYNRNALFTFLTSDGYDDVYIPTGSDADRIYGTDTAVQSILAAPPEDVPVSFTEKAVTDALLNVSGNAGNYLSRDFTSAATVIRQFMRIEIFITVLLLYVLVIKGFIKDVAKQKDVELTRKLVFSLKWLIVALGCLLAYRFAAFELYINPRFISSVRLLDFEFYWSMIKNAAQERNLYYAYVPPLFERLYNYALVFNALCFVLYCVILKPLSRRRGAIRNED